MNKPSLNQLLLVLSLAGFASLAAVQAPPAPPAPPVALTLLFDYPTNETDTNLTFVLHGSTNLATPILEWAVDAVLPVSTFYSNGVVNVPVEGDKFVFSLGRMVAPGVRYWYVTASNFWGESLPSNVLAMPAAPRSDMKLRVVKP